MKKIYSTPATQVFEVKTEGMIAMSLSDKVDGNSENQFGREEEDMDLWASDEISNWAAPGKPW